MVDLLHHPRRDEVYDAIKKAQNHGDADPEKTEPELRY